MGMVGVLDQPRTMAAPRARRPGDVVAGGHGRQDRRTLPASRDRTGDRDGPGLEQGVRLDRHRRTRTRGKAEQAGVSGLTRLTPAHAAAAPRRARTRADWRIANGLPHRRAVTFHADATRRTRGQAGRVRATLGHLVSGRRRHVIPTPSSPLPAAAPTPISNYRLHS